MRRVYEIKNIKDTVDVVSFDVVHDRFLSSIFGLKTTRVTISNLLTCPYFSRIYMTEELFHMDSEIRMFATENMVMEITTKSWFMDRYSNG